MRFNWVEALVAAALVLGGCKDKGRDEKKVSPDTKSGQADPSNTREVAIPWKSDDWDGAVAAARKDKKPIFVDLWAPWCHTCLSMKQVVMIDPSLAPFLDRFVWLEIDTDRPQNAAALEKVPVDVWPTLYVLSATEAGETIQARHLGAASIAQLREMLEQGEQAHLASMAKEGKLDPSSPLGMVQAGDAAAARGDMAAADEKYGKALAASPQDWSRAPAVLVKQIRARLLSGDKAGCAELGMTQSGRAAQGMTASVTDFAAAADMCADALDDPRARLLRGRLAEAIRKVVDAGDSAMSVDDQADALRVLRELALAVQDTTSARAYAVKQRDLLDRAVAEAKTATARMTYSFPRTEVYEYLGEGAKMVPELEKLAADLPEEYDPPARLARLQFKLGKYDEALAAAEMAMPRIYGPRKTGILELVADIHKAKGDVEAERKARQAVFDHLSSLTGAHRDDAKLTEAQAALAAVGKAPRKPKKKNEKEN